MSRNQGTHMQDRNISTAFLKGLRLLACFEDGGRGLTMPDLSQRTGFDRATTRRLCLTLVESGYLLRRERHFALAPRVLALAGSYLHAREIGFAVQPVLNAFAEDLGNDIALAVLDGDWALLLAQSSTTRSRISMGFTVGSRLPLPHTAIGIALLSHVPREGRTARLAGLTSRPIDGMPHDPEILPARVDRAEQDGFAVAVGEFEAGIKGLAVAVGERGPVPFAIGASMPASLTDDTKTRETLQLCAARLAKIQALIQ